MVWLLMHTLISVVLFHKDFPLAVSSLNNVFKLIHVRYDNQLLFV